MLIHKFAIPLVRPLYKVVPPRRDSQGMAIFLNTTFGPSIDRTVHNAGRYQRIVASSYRSQAFSRSFPHILDRPSHKRRMSDHVFRNRVQENLRLSDRSQHSLVATQCAENRHASRPSKGSVREFLRRSESNQGNSECIVASRYSFESSFRDPFQSPPMRQIVSVQIEIRF